MKLFIDGNQKPTRWTKGTDKVVPCLVTEDDGALHDLTGGTVDILAYASSDRSGAATVLAGTKVVATGGSLTIALTPASFASVAVGSTWYLFARHTDTSILISENAVALEVR